MANRHSDVPITRKPMSNRIKDLTGKRYGRLVVTAYYGVRSAHSFWECVCDCGAVKIVSQSVLREGSVHSCGCVRSNDLTGKRFTRITVLGRAGRRFTPRSSMYMYTCRCDCGKVWEVSGSELMAGTTKSCGCLSKEMTVARVSTHGLSWTKRIKADDECTLEERLAHRWVTSRDRGVVTKESPFYDWEVFRDWAMKNGFQHHTQYKPRDKTKPLSPDNVIIYHLKMSRTNEPFTAFGHAASLTWWADFVGMNVHTVRRRMLSVGLTLEESLTRPLGHKVSNAVWAARKVALATRVAELLQERKSLAGEVRASARYCHVCKEGPRLPRDSPSPRYSRIRYYCDHLQRTSEEPVTYHCTKFMVNIGVGAKDAPKRCAACKQLCTCIK